MRGNVHVRFGGEARETRPLQGGRCALVLTLHLIHFPTLIFHEITFNLGTMMQAAARAYRLNQTHDGCKTVYLFAEGTMEHTAVQLMSRKQRAAKLLTGDIGLTGLDALTEGESGFEEALLDAIAKDTALLDPSELFKAGAAGSEIDAEDAAYWNVAVAEEPEAAAIHPDPVVQTAIELGGVIAEPAAPRLTPTPAVSSDTARLVWEVGRYLDTVHLVHDEAKRTRLQAKLLAALQDGVQDDEGTYTVVGLHDPDFARYPVHAETLTRWVRGWLKAHRFVFAGCEEEVAAEVVRLARAALLPVAELLERPTPRPAKPRLTPEPVPARPFVPSHTPHEAETVQLALL